MEMSSVVIVEQASGTGAVEESSTVNRASQQVLTPSARPSTPNAYLKSSHTRVFDDIGKRAVQKEASRQKL